VTARGARTLTTHVLDTARGRPAGGLRVDLAAIEAEIPEVVNPP